MRPITITLDKSRTLSYGLNAMCALEEAGYEVASIADLERPRVLRAVLWAGLLHEEPTLTQEDVGALVADLGDLGRIAVAIVEALNAGQPDAEPKKKRPPKARR